MIKKTLAQNKFFFGILPMFILFFVFTLFYGSKRIYEREAGWEHDIASAQLSSAKSMVSTFISNLEHHLFYVRELAGVKSFVGSDFDSPGFQKEAENILRILLKATPEISEISVLDCSGFTRLKLLKLDAEIGISTSGIGGNRHDVMQSMSCEDSKYVRIDPAPVPTRGGFSAPMLEVAAPLTDEKGNHKGIMILSSYVTSIFKELPENIFLKIEPGKVISSPSEKHTILHDLPNDKDREGQLTGSDAETVHYSTLDLSPGASVIIGIIHRHIGLKTALQKLVITSLLLLGVFFSFVLVFTYLNLSRVQQKNRAQKALITSLVELTDWRDPETGAHLRRTTDYSVELARELKKDRKFNKMITEEFLENLHDAAPLHDIGKVGIKDAVLLKEEKLNENEFEEIKKHVVIGRQILQDIIDRFEEEPSFLLMARNIAAHHHEKYDGKGYPDGKRDGEIPLEARIFALADVYDALRSKRPYKKEMSHEDAANIIRGDKGTHFDPDIVDAFFECEPKFLELSENNTSNTPSSS